MLTQLLSKHSNKAFFAGISLSDITPPFQAALTVGQRIMAVIYPTVGNPYGVISLLDSLIRPYLQSFHNWLP